jgi:hypothetical protein
LGGRQVLRFLRFLLFKDRNPNVHPLLAKVQIEANPHILSIGNVQPRSYAKMPTMPLELLFNFSDAKLS